MPSRSPAADGPAPSPTSPRCFTPEEQQAFGQLILRGASPALACLELDLSIDDFWHTLRHDPHFHRGLRQLYDTLSQNVVAALYKHALQGDASAQKQWWQLRADLHGPFALQPTSSVPTGAPSCVPEVAQLSDAELVERLREALPVVLSVLDRGILSAGQ
uniref:Uncharacterized protein n=1 Tax=Schlesneria paludicola TaxID=360056 RepID=A0A7C4QMY3_9PLAN